MTQNYKCKNNHRWEKWYPEFREPPPICPKCKKKGKKIISGGTFVLKGEGFYQNDYKK